MSRLAKRAARSLNLLISTGSHANQLAPHPPSYAHCSFPVILSPINASPIPVIMNSTMWPARHPSPWMQYYTALGTSSHSYGAGLLRLCSMLASIRCAELKRCYHICVDDSPWLLGDRMRVHGSLVITGSCTAPVRCSKDCAG
jgi:hypothetical protein